MPRLLALVAVTASALMLSSCGFRPLYGDRAGASGQALAGVEIASIEGRLGQRLRNVLVDRFQPGGRAERADYRLQVRVDASDTLLDNQFDNATLNNTVSVNASYELRDSAGQIVDTGIAQAFLYKSPVPGQYALLVAQQDAYLRAVDLIAGDITRKVSLFMDRRPRPAGPA